MIADCEDPGHSVGVLVRLGEGAAAGWRRQATLGGAAAAGDVRGCCCGRAERDELARRLEEAELRCLRGGAGDRRDWRCCSEVVAAMVVGDFRGAAVRRENLRFMCQW